jgi:hypothetical protein
MALPHHLHRQPLRPGPGRFVAPAAREHRTTLRRPHRRPTRAPAVGEVQRQRRPAATGLHGASAHPRPGLPRLAQARPRPRRHHPRPAHRSHRPYRRTGRGNITWHLPQAWPWETAWRNSPKTSNTRSTRYRKNTSGFRQRFRARDHRVDHLPPWSIQVPGNKSENGRKRIGRGIAQQPVQGVNGKSRASKGVGFPRRDEVCRHLGMVPAQGESINADLLLDGRAVPESD